jgi:hypothetical protein
MSEEAKAAIEAVMGEQAETVLLDEGIPGGEDVNALKSRIDALTTEN